MGKIEIRTNTETALIGTGRETESAGGTEIEKGTVIEESEDALHLLLVWMSLAEKYRVRTFSLLLLRHPFCVLRHCEPKQAHTSLFVAVTALRVVTEMNVVVIIESREGPERGTTKVREIMKKSERRGRGRGREKRRGIGREGGNGIERGRRRGRGAKSLRRSELRERMV